jgi:hypothetical protein
MDEAQSCPTYSGEVNLKVLMKIDRTKIRDIPRYKKTNEEINRQRNGHTQLKFVILFRCS